MGLLLAAGFASGACIGSAGGVALSRWPRGATMSRPLRSACDSCGRTLAALELIPILSWLALRGRCRTCRARISTELLLVEVGCAILVTTTLLHHPLPLAMLAAVVGCGLVIATATDVRAMIVPDLLTRPLGVWAVVASLILAGRADASVGPWTVVGGALVVPTALRLATSVSVRLTGRILLGGGDIKLLVALLAVVVHIDGGALRLWLFSLLPAGLVALVGLASGRLARGQALPFVPFLLVGWFAAVGVDPRLVAMTTLLAGTSW